MDNTLFIRSLYQPLQPAENASGKGKLFYKEYTPSLPLQPYIHCFWELNTPEHLTETYAYRVVADGCIDLILDNRQYNGLLIAGIASNAFDISLNGHISYFGIRFLPGCIRQFFHFAASDIVNEMIAANDVLNKEVNAFAAKLFEKKTIAAKIQLTENFLLTRLHKLNNSLHPQLASALHYILSGNASAIETKAGWISPRQLRRLFHDHVGCSPKLFSRIVRFQQSLYALEKKQTGSRSSFFGHGYFDQSHFIKEFKAFYGETPSLVSPV